MDSYLTMFALALPDVPDGVESLGFFALLKDFLDEEIKEYSENLLTRVGLLVAMIAAPLVTLWIMYQGFMRATGRSQESMAALVADASRIVLITLIAFGTAGAGPKLYLALTDGMSQTINWAISGQNEVTVYDDIDEALLKMQLAMSSIDLLDVGNDPIAAQQRDKAAMMAGLGVGGPAVVGGTMLLLNKFVMALLTGVGPFFIMCLVFKQTESLFKGWLNALLGSLMSLAFLTVGVHLALDITLAIAGAFWVTEGLSRWFGMGTASDGIDSLAQMQGITGLVMTALILTAPAAAAGLFRGLVNFNPQATMAGPGGKRSAGRTPHRADEVTPVPVQLPPVSGTQTSPQEMPGSRGINRS